MLQIVTGAERDSSAGRALPEVSQPGVVIVVASQAVLVGIRKVVSGELVKVGGAVAQHGDGEVLEEVRQAGRDVEIHRGRRHSAHFQQTITSPAAPLSSTLIAPRTPIG